MDPRWQPNLGPMHPAAPTPEACALLAAGWHAQSEECWIARDGGLGRLVALDTWRALRDRAGFLRPRLQLQHS